MSRILITLLATVLAGSVHAGITGGPIPWDNHNGHDIVDGCQRFARPGEDHSDQLDTDFKRREALFYMGYCAGLIKGVGLAVKRTKQFCPPDSTLTGWAEIFLKVSEEQPDLDLLVQKDADAVATALTRGYPCEPAK